MSDRQKQLQDDVRLLNVLRADVVAFGLGGKSDPAPYLEAFDRAIAAYIDYDDVKRLRTEIRRNAQVQTELRENLIAQRDEAIRQANELEQKLKNAIGYNHR